MKTKTLLSLVLALTITSNLYVYAKQDKNIDEYITLNQSVPNLENSTETGSRDEYILEFNLPVEEVSPYLNSWGMKDNYLFKLEIKNGSWRSVQSLSRRTDAADIEFFENTLTDFDDEYYWDIDNMLHNKGYSAKNPVVYDDDFYEKYQYVNAQLDNNKYSSQTIDIIDGEYPLCYKALGNVGDDVTVDVYIYSGDDYISDSTVKNDKSKTSYKYIVTDNDYQEEDYVYLGSITLAHITSGNDMYPSEKAEETTQPTTETTTEVTTDTQIEIPINQTYYLINGERYYTDSPAYIENDYTMLPLRSMASIVGNVSYIADTKTAVITYGNKEIYITAGESTMYINGTAYPLDTKAVIKEGRMYLPMRAISEALGFNDISFDTLTKTVKINL